MINLIKCHFHYLINRITVWIMFMVFLISIIASIINIMSLNSSSTLLENNRFYFYDSFLFVKIIGVFLGIFIYVNSFTQKFDQYAYLFCAFGISRTKYFLTKIISIQLFLLMFIWFEFFFFTLIGFLGYKYFIFQSDYWVSYLNLYLLFTFFGNLGLIFHQLINNIYVIIIPFTIMNVGTVINENEEHFIFNLFNALFPNFISEKTEFVYGLLHVNLLIIVLVMINLIIYQQKDL